jgi:hypothetical protein
VSRGRGGVRKKKREQEEDDEENPDSDTVAVGRSKWEELSEMKKVIKDFMEHLAVCERVTKEGRY